MFKDRVPELVQQNENTSRFLDVLDGMQSFKTEILSKAIRVNNYGVTTNKKWILKRLNDYGIDVPMELPLEVLIQVLLNADTLCRTRGSKIGIEFYCSVFSLGEVEVNDEDFYNQPKLLLLDSLEQGYIAEDTEKPNFCLCSSNDDFNGSVEISISISSKYFNGSYPDEAEVIQKFINDTLPNQLGFSPNKTINVSFDTNTDFYFHKLLNPYFV